MTSTNTFSCNRLIIKLFGFAIAYFKDIGRKLRHFRAYEDTYSASRRIVASLLLICLSTTLSAQDLDRVTEKDFLRIGGYVGSSQVLYFNQGIAARRVPYTYVYQGNLNLDFLGVTSTLNFMYTNPQFSKNISNPFNTFAYHPKYKGLTLHIGRISSSYSPYTLNGHLYEGGGFDYTPKKIPIIVSASFGRFQRAIAPDSNYLADSLSNSRVLTPGMGPSYLRWGGGFKLQWNPKAFKLGIIGFKAKDDASSLANLPSDVRLKPQENTVVSINVSKPIYKQLSLNGEIALSALNSNILAERSASSNVQAFRLMGMDAKQGSGLYKAYKVGMAYTAQLFTLGVSYERIDPNYKTLGAYFFNNDLENTTVDFSSQLFKQKLNLSTNLGLQRDDLAHNKASNMRRLVGSLNLNFIASQRLTFNASYSNFRSYSNTRALSQTLTASPTTYIDTLQYRQISQNANLGYNYVLSNKEKVKQNINGNITYQNSADIQGEQAAMDSKFYNFTLGYGLQFVPQAFGINVSGNGSRNDFDKNATTLLGPSLTVTKAFFKKKLRSNATATYVVSQGTGNSKIMTLRAGLAYTLKKNHNFNFNLIYLDSDTQSTKRLTFKEYTFTAAYAYTFKVFDKDTLKSKTN